MFVYRKFQPLFRACPVPQRSGRETSYLLSALSRSAVAVVFINIHLIEFGRVKGLCFRYSSLLSVSHITELSKLSGYGGQQERLGMMHAALVPSSPSLFTSLLLWLSSVVLLSLLDVGTSWLSSRLELGCGFVR